MLETAAVSPPFSVSWSPHFLALPHRSASSSHQLLVTWNVGHRRSFHDSCIVLNLPLAAIWCQYMSMTALNEPVYMIWNAPVGHQFSWNYLAICVCPGHRLVRDVFSLAQHEDRKQREWLFLFKVSSKHFKADLFEKKLIKNSMFDCEMN